LLTKQEKAWFFLLCGDRTKINKLIFLIFIYQPLFALGRNEVCPQFEGAARLRPLFFGIFCPFAGTFRQKRLLGSVFCC
jgi:hypothetical protein